MEACGGNGGCASCSRAQMEVMEEMGAMVAMVEGVVAVEDVGECSNSALPLPSMPLLQCVNANLLMKIYSIIILPPHQ